MAVDRDGGSSRVKVLLDTNALTMPVQFGLDLFGELDRLFGNYQPLILKESIVELKRLAKGTGINATAARVGLALAERCAIVEGDERIKTVDERIAQYAESTHCAVVTNDSSLKSTLEKRNIPVISMRKLKKLEIGGRHQCISE